MCYTYYVFLRGHASCSMSEVIKMFKRLLCIILSIALMVSMLTGCSLDFRHVEVSEQDNTNSNIDDWDDIDDPDI